MQRLLVFPGTDFSGSPDSSVFSTLEEQGIHIEHAVTTDSVSQRLHHEPIAVCLLDCSNAEMSNSLVTRFMADSRRNIAGTQFVIIADDDRVDVASFAHDPRVTLISPASTTHLHTSLLAAVKRSELQVERNNLKCQLRDWIVRDLVGDSDAMQRLRERIHQVALQNNHILIHGEPGSGVSLCAKALQTLSRQVGQHPIHVDCRITSAESFKRDVLKEIPSHEFPLRIFQEDRSNEPSPESGSRVTLILDHLEAAPFATQDFVISLLDKPQYQLRVIACTHKDLHEMAARGEFRDGLLHRLGRESITVPALRERTQDIGPLAETFLQQASEILSEQPRRLSLAGLECLEKHHWPGNVSELSRLIENISNVEQETTLTPSEIEPWIHSDEEPSASEPNGLSLRVMERKLIESTFARYRGNREKTAKSLQIGLRTLSGKLREYGYPPRGGPGSNLQSTVRKAA